MVTGKFKKEIKKKEKIYFVDMGILRLTLGYDADNIDVFKGILVENFVFSQIFYNLEEYLESYFWANHNEVEIDFVIKNLVDNSLVCIDAKQKDKDNIPK
jgi:predicted AAA+ superfamily ATPase